LKLYFLFDAQMPPRLAQGIELIDQENRDGKHINVRISHVATLYGNGVTDLEVITKAKELGAIIVSEDPDFYTIEVNKQLLKQLNVGCVVYKPPAHGTRYWEKTLAFILGWENIKELVRESIPPFLIRVDKKGNAFHEALK
jgi:hypothetical protein